MQSGQYTAIGNWWDRRGGNEIDMIALNEFDKTGVVAEIKRNKKKASLQLLQNKMAMLPQEFAKYNLTPQILSMEDL